MFEETFVGTGALARKSWTFTVSLLSQSLAIAAAMLLPLTGTPVLPGGSWTAMLAEPPAAPPAPPPKRAAPPAAHRPQRFAGRLAAPTSMPDRAAAIVDVEELGPIESPPGIVGVGGVVGVEGFGGVPGGLSLTLVRPPPPPPVRPKPAREPTVVGGDVQAAKLIRRVQPVYPRLARQARVSGVVRLRAVISSAGVIEKLEVLRGHPLLVQTALEAVAQWRYAPTLLNGQPVAVITEIDVHFTLR